jgi:RNA recognition motif-containing protein
LFIGNLPYQASESDIRTLMSQAGSVESVKIITDQDTGRPKGFGFVEMASDEEAQQAITMFNGKNFMDRSLTVNEAKPQQPRDRDRGRGGGGHGGWGRRGP